MSGAASGVRPEQRYNASRPCPICGGHGNKPRGIGERCTGFTSVGGEWARCSREEFAGAAPYDDKTGAYVHKLTGNCKCGARHGFPTSGPPPNGNGHARREKGQRRRIVKTYDYQDEHRNVIHQTVRYEPKDFSQRRPDGRGGWIWSLKGARLVSYRYPELLEADRDSLTLVCAGEKDTDTAAALGFVATTNPLGEGNWRSEYSEPLRGRPVAIIAHNDEAGRKHAENVARSLYGKAASVKVINLPGVPEDGGDLTDWTDAGGKREELEHQIDEAPEWTPPEERDDGRVLLGRVIREGVAPPEELVEDVVLKGKTCAIYGPSGYGKTYVLLWLVLEVIKQGLAVLLFDNENNVGIIAERLEQLGADPDELDRLIHYHPFPELPTTDEGRELFEAMLDRINPALVCYDSWISFLADNGLDENSSNDIAAFSSHYFQPARRRGITTLVLDHVPHEGNHARGSTRKRDEVDVMWSLSRLRPFDRDRVGSIVLNRIKDREGWLPTSVTFSVGGTGDGGFMFSRSSGTIETEDEEGLKDSERNSLKALETFGEKGAKTVQWQKKAHTFEVSRTSFYRAFPELERKGWIFQENKRFFIKRSHRSQTGTTEPNGTDHENGPIGTTTLKGGTCGTNGYDDDEWMSF